MGLFAFRRSLALAAPAVFASFRNGALKVVVMAIPAIVADDDLAGALVAVS